MNKPRELTRARPQLTPRGHEVDKVPRRGPCCLCEIFQRRALTYGQSRGWNFFRGPPIFLTELHLYINAKSFVGINSNVVTQKQVTILFLKTIKNFLSEVWEAAAHRGGSRSRILKKERIKGREARSIRQLGPEAVPPQNQGL